MAKMSDAQKIMSAINEDNEFPQILRCGHNITFIHTISKEKFRQMATALLQEMDSEDECLKNQVSEFSSSSPSSICSRVENSQPGNPKSLLDTVTSYTDADNSQGICNSFRGDSNASMKKRANLSVKKQESLATLTEVENSRCETLPENGKGIALADQNYLCENNLEKSVDSRQSELSWKLVGTLKNIDFENTDQMDNSENSVTEMNSPELNMDLKQKDVEMNENTVTDKKEKGLDTSHSFEIMFESSSIKNEEKYIPNIEENSEESVDNISIRNKLASECSPIKYIPPLEPRKKETVDREENRNKETSVFTPEGVSSSSNKSNPNDQKTRENNNAEQSHTWVSGRKFLENEELTQKENFTKRESIIMLLKNKPGNVKERAIMFNYRSQDSTKYENKEGSPLEEVNSSKMDFKIEQKASEPCDKLDSANSEKIGEECSLTENVDSDEVVDEEINEECNVPKNSEFEGIGENCSSYENVESEDGDIDEVSDKKSLPEKVESEEEIDGKVAEKGCLSKIEESEDEVDEEIDAKRHLFSKVGTVNQTTKGKIRFVKADSAIDSPSLEITGCWMFPRVMAKAFVDTIKSEQKKSRVPERQIFEDSGCENAENELGDNSTCINLKMREEFSEDESKEKQVSDQSSSAENEGVTEAASKGDTTENEDGKSVDDSSSRDPIKAPKAASRYTFRRGKSKRDEVDSAPTRAKRNVASKLYKEVIPEHSSVTKSSKTNLSNGSSHAETSSVATPRSFRNGNIVQNKTKPSLRK